MTHDLVVTNALVVTADAAGTVMPDGAVAVAGGRIARVGTGAEVGREAREVIDARGHAADARADQHPLPCRRQPVPRAGRGPAARALAAGRSGRRKAAILNRRHGAARRDARLRRAAARRRHHGDGHVLAPARDGRRGARASGVRVSTGGIFFDGPGVDGRAQAERLADAEAFFDEFAGADDVLPGCFPHGAYTVGPESLQAAKRLADGARRALLAPTPPRPAPSRRRSRRRYGRSVIRHLDALGLLDARTVLAHCVWLDDEEIAILARTGATVAHNPVSNLKLASGIARVPDMLAAGVRVTLGTDGAISGNDLDMWMALRLAATLHRARRCAPTRSRRAQALRMVDARRRRGARARPTGSARWSRASSPT